MAMLHGKEGKVKFGNDAIAKITRIRVNTTAPVAETTAMGDSWQTHLPGIPGWTAEVEGRYDPADSNGQATIDSGDSVSIGFYVQGDDAGKVYHSGTATITASTIEGTLTEAGSFTMQVTGNGALTRATVGA